MSGRQDKKLRQLHRKDFNEVIFSLEKRMRTLVKPPPRWCPLFLWKWAQSKFLNLE